ncbi:MAG: HRDC domain-containing protein [Acholeplasmataceae bacterium]|nr:HRDC domain-containing protein [Acholeplasmataceae bacterium]
MAIKIQLGKKREYNYPKSIKEVDELSGEQFEMFIFKYMKEFAGYSGKITEKNDFGVDILLWKSNDEMVRFGVQCKRYGPKTILGENDLMKMQKGVPHYGISRSESGKPNLILFTSAEEQQVTSRGIAYIENEEIEAYYRDDIIEIIKDIDEKLGRDVNQSNYSNIAFESSKKKKESFKENSKFVDMLKLERKNIAKYNKISPIYLVYNDRTIKDIIIKKPTTLEELKKIKGFTEDNVKLFGPYLIHKIREFLEVESNSEKINPIIEINKEEFVKFLKETRKKIATYNKIDKLYNVFNNKTLEEIVDKVPKTEDELMNISGIGKVKTDLWGKYLLTDIEKFIKS